MSAAARSIRVFGCYMLAVAAILVIWPNGLLSVFGVEPTSEPWIRIVGVLMGFIGYYQLRAVAANLKQFFAWTIPPRFALLGFFCAFVILQLAPTALLIFGFIDAAGAAWTWRALRCDARAQTCLEPGR